MTYQAAVQSGKGRGRRLGFPTLNLVIPDPFPFQFGVYAAWVTVGRKRYLAAVHFGPTPTFNEKVAMLEAHLIGVSLVHTPVRVELEMVERLREVRVFKDPEGLIAQIKRDVAAARRKLNASAGS